MNKKILTLLFLGMFLISFASAMDFDNDLTYSDGDKKVKIKNLFGWGTEYGDIEITSHEDLNKPIGLPTGWGEGGRIVLDGKEEYKDLLKIEKTSFRNMKNGEDIDIPFYWEKAVEFKTITKNIMIEVCGENVYPFLNNNLGEHCWYEKDGTYEEDIVTKWEKIEGKLDIKKDEEITIRLMVYVRKGDHIDFIPDMFGKKIDKWAEYENTIEEYIGDDLDASDAGKTGIGGNMIYVKSAGKVLINVTKDSTATTTTAYIYSATNQSVTLGSLLDTASYVGLTATFEYPVTQGEFYWLVDDKEGAPYNNAYHAGSGLGFVEGTNIDWVYSRHSSGSALPTNYIDIEFATLGDLIVIVPTFNIIFPLEQTYNFPITELNYTFTNTSLMESCWNSIDLGETNSTPVTCGTNFSGLSSSEGSNTWTVYGNFTTGELGNTTSTFTIDSIPPEIVINYPNNYVNHSYLISGTNFTLNTTITDTNLQTCWFNYNSTNTTFPCTSGVLSTNTTQFSNETTLIVYANDSAGNQNSSSLFWSYDLFDFNEYTYDLNTSESSTTIISGLFQTGSALSSSFLQYNNTNYSNSINALGGNRYILSSSLVTPTVAQDTNITWFFIVNNINATELFQTIININLDDCSAYGFSIVNYTLVDELAQDLITHANSTIESSVTLRTTMNQDVVQFNQVFNGTSSAQVCSEINVTNSGLRLWEQSRYGSNNYVFEQHNLQNASLSGGQTDVVLRDLPSPSATTFRLVYKSSTFLPVEDAVVQIQRKYIGEGVYKEVESPITDANGEASASFDLNAVIYRIVVREFGTTTSTFENPAVVCDNILTGDCKINLNEGQSVTQINTWDDENGIGYSLTQENRTISLIFEITSGEAKTINLLVDQSTILGNETSCDQSLLATSGRIDCVIDDTLGDVFFSATVYEDRSQYFGTDNIVLTFFLVLSLVLLTISSPITVLLGIVIGLIGSSMMMFLNSGNVFGQTSVLMYIIIVVFILIVKISGRKT